MSVEDWKQRNTFSVALMLLHSFKVGFYFFIYLKDKFDIDSRTIISAICKLSNEKDTPFINEFFIGNINKWTSDILKGEGRGIYVKEYSDVFLDIEEKIFIDVSKNFPLFYKEFNFLLKKILGDKNYNEDLDVINEITQYQILRMPTQSGKNKEQKFKYNVAEYMFEKLSQNKIELKVSPNTINSV